MDVSGLWARAPVVPRSLLCSSRRRPFAEADLCTRAGSGALEQYCVKCFYLAEIKDLLWVLPANDQTVEVASDGLATVWALLRERASELERMRSTDRC